MKFTCNYTMPTLPTFVMSDLKCINTQQEFALYHNVDVNPYSSNPNHIDIYDYLELVSI